MDEKKNAIFTISIIAVILLVYTAADFFHGDRVYSQMENRILAGKPDFTKNTFLSGEFSADYEEYVTDQFIGRDKWVEIKTRMDITFQKKDINGVYLGKDGYLIEQHKPEDYSRQQEVKKAVLLQNLVEEWDARVMLVPTADNILTDKLPDNASYYDETGLLKQVRELVGERNYVDVYSILEEHKNEEIYYRTDHHWTTLGAYYGYQAWAESVNHYIYPYETENMTIVSDDFQGSLHSKVPVIDTRDQILYFPETADRKVSVIYDNHTVTDSLYEERRLDTKNQYGFFLDDNHAFVEIQTSYYNGKTLFLIKDSYANSMIPLLMPYYQTIYVVDLRYYNGKLSDLMTSCRPEKPGYEMDVLILYNCVHFMEDFWYY